MTRVDLIELLQQLFPQMKIYNIGQHYAHSIEPYIVVREATQLPDYTGSRLGAYQIFDIMVYVPDSSVLWLDTVMNELYEKLRRSLPYGKYFQFTRNVSNDYHDLEIEMYTRYITIQVPREWGAPV